MSLNNLQLHPQLLAGLYNQVLIETEAGSVTKPAIKTLGGNKKNILLVVCDTQHPDALPDQSLQFLISILKACQLTLADVAITATDGKQELDYKTITSQLGSRQVLLFNLEPVAFGLP